MRIIKSLQSFTQVGDVGPTHPLSRLLSHTLYLTFSRISYTLSHLSTPPFTHILTPLSASHHTIQVTLDPLPDIDTLCKFIITDEHWLQDNVLALLR